MLMLQRYSGLVRHNPTAAPRDIVAVVNELLFDNICNRMATGRALYVDVVPIRQEGTWCSLRAPKTSSSVAPLTSHRAAANARRVGRGHCDIRDITDECRCELQEGDILLLYDGRTEAMNSRGEMFGGDRLAAALGAHRYNR